MSCHGLHHACECKEDLLRDAVDSLAHILSGLKKYRKSLAIYDRITLSKTVHGIPEAISVIRRANKI